MPDFSHDGHVYYNPLEFAMAHIGGTWKSPILYRLKKEKQRFSELKKSMAHISDRQLAAALRELEQHGLVSRKVTPTVPVTVEYSITPLGRTLSETVDALRIWAERHMGDVAKAQAQYDRTKA